jgi:hypothetical protein
MNKALFLVNLVGILVFPGLAGAEVSVATEGSYRLITSDGLPDHEPGQFPNAHNPNTIAAQDYHFRVPLQPRMAAGLTKVEGRQLFGVALNGVPFDPGTAEAWNNDRSSGWNYDALSGAVDLGLDENNAHVQPNGAYHYHGIPQALTGGPARHSPLIGYAADGFPVYALYGYLNARDAASGIAELRSSYRLKEGRRPSGPGGSYDGSFVQDFEYKEGAGDLDECNGREGATPEYPQGTYYYVLTKQFPFVPRCLKGAPDQSFIKAEAHGGPGGMPGGQTRGGPGQGSRRTPPPEAIDACSGRSEGDACGFQAPMGRVDGECRQVPEGQTACVPAGGRRGPQ